MRAYCIAFVVACVHDACALPRRTAALSPSDHLHEPESALSLAAAGHSASARASDYWPCKNGNLNHTGATTSVAPSNLASPPSWRWISDYPGDVVRATPLVDASSNIYLATVNSGRVLKFDANGHELWRYSTVGRPFNNSCAAADPLDNDCADPIISVPALMGGHLFLVTKRGSVRSLDMMDGTERWRTETADRTNGGGCYAVAAGFSTVIVATKGGGHAATGAYSLHAFEPEHGTKLWQFDLPDEDQGAVYNVMISLLASPSGNAFAVFCSAVGKVYKLDLLTGEAIWSVEGPTPGSFGTGGAVVGPDDTIYATSNLAAGNGTVSAYALEDGALRWRVDLGADMPAQVAPSVGRLAGPTSPLSVVVSAGTNPSPLGGAEPAKTLALDAATGALVWQYDMPLWHGAAAGDGFPEQHGCAPDSSANNAIGGDGVTYVPHEDGRVYAIRDADGDGVISQGEVSSWGFGMTFQGSPAIAPGLLAVSPCDGLAAWHAHH